MATPKIETKIRKEQIAQAALFLAGKDGWKGVSMASIAHHIDLVPSAIYRHYQNKDEILDAVIDLIHDRLMTNLDRALIASDDAIGRLQSVLMLHMAMIKENQGIPRLIFSGSMYDDNPAWKRKVYLMIVSYLAKIADIIREGQHIGHISKECDPDTLAMMFLGLIQPAAFLRHLGENEFDIDTHATTSWKLFSERMLNHKKGTTAL